MASDQHDVDKTKHTTIKWSTCSTWWFQCFIHLIWLYAIGIYHLLRQLLISVPTPRSSLSFSSFSRVRPVVILTGATSGIGLQIFNLLKGCNLTSQLILLTHAPSSSTTKSEYSHFSSTSNNVHSIPIDLNDESITNKAITAVQKLLKDKATYQPPVLLIHCAAAYNPPLPRKAEATFMINSLMPMLLLHRLRHVLNAVVVLGSASHDIAPALNMNQCPVSMAPSPSLAYPASKGLLLGIVRHWSNKSLVSAIVIHPGIVASGLYDHEEGLKGTILRKLIRLLAWDTMSAAIRVLHIIESASLLNVGLCNTIPLYWDAVTLSACRIPRHLSPVEVSPCVQWMLKQLDLSME